MAIKEITTGQDSFLDIVANLVGILIILVVVVGAQASASPKQPVEKAELVEKIAELERENSSRNDVVAKLEIDNQQLETQIVKENELAANLTDLRHEMLVQLSIVKRQIEKQRIAINKRNAEQVAKQDAAKLAMIQRQNEFEIEQQKLIRELEDLEKEKNAVSLAAHVTIPNTKVIDHFPNPIAKTVFSEEIHFRLAGGKLSFVPMDELIAKMKAEWKMKAEKLSSASRTLETVGPIDGFRLQYELVSQQVNSRSGARRKNIKFKQFTIHPMARGVGESVDRALSRGSVFQQILGRHEPRKTTVSIWVYPDSYSEHNRIKKMLHGNGYQMASWPLENGKKISGGPDGFKTSAQ